MKRWRSSMTSPRAASAIDGPRRPGAFVPRLALVRIEDTEELLLFSRIGCEFAIEPSRYACPDDRYTPYALLILTEGTSLARIGSLSRVDGDCGASGCCCTSAAHVKPLSPKEGFI